MDAEKAASLKAAANAFPSVTLTERQLCHDTYVGERFKGLQPPYHYDFETLRDTPQELRHLFDKHG